MPRSDYMKLWGWITRNFDFSEYMSPEEARAALEDYFAREGSIGALMALGTGYFDDLIAREVIRQAIPEYLPEWYESTERESLEEWT